MDSNFELRCGFAQENITPELNGTFLDGYGFRMSPATGIRDDLFVKVCALQCGNDKFIIASFDLIGFSPEVYRLIADQVTAFTGIPRENMALCAIHTHAAPTCGTLAQLPINYDYHAFVGEMCGRAAVRAFDRAVAGGFSCEITPEELIHSFNRRGRDIIDRSIRAASFIDTEGRLRGVICSAACHAVINTAMTVSADFLAVLNRVSSDDIPYMYLQGRAADINPHQNADEGLDIDALIEKLGGELAYPVKKVAEAASGTPNKPLYGDLTHEYELVSLPMNDYPDEKALTDTIAALEKAYFSLPRNDPNKHYNLRELEWSRMTLGKIRAGKTPELTVPLQTLAFGCEFVFAFIPFELLTLTGNRLEDYYAGKGFDRARIFIIGYANSVNGYLAPPEEFVYGGYEVSGASHWYGDPGETSVKTEPAVVEWFMNR